MKASDLRTKSAKDLNEELVSLRREQFALRLQRATGNAPKPDQFGKVRKNIARLKTVQGEQRRGVTPVAAPAVEAKPVKAKTKGKKA